MSQNAGCNSGSDAVGHKLGHSPVITIAVSTLLMLLLLVGGVLLVAVFCEWIGVKQTFLSVGFSIVPDVRPPTE